MRRRVLLAWEVGRGRGYTGRLALLAEALGRRGHTCRIALREVPTDGSLAGHDVVQAPFSMTYTPTSWPWHDAFSPTSFADLAGAHGLESPVALTAVTRSWSELLDDFRPDVIVAEFAPTLGVAALGRVPVVQIGTSYTVPAVAGGWFVSHAPSAIPLFDQTQLLEHVAEARRAVSLPRPDSLAAALSGDVRLCYELPELDSYERRSDTTRWTGPFQVRRDDAVAHGERAGIYAWLDPEMTVTAEVLGRLASGRTPARVALRPGPKVAAFRQRFAAPHVTYHEDLPPLEEGAGGAKVVVHHGGVDTSLWCVLHGRRQVVAHGNLEQRLRATRLVALALARPFAKTLDVDALVAEGGPLPPGAWSKHEPDGALAAHVDAVESL